MTFVILGRLNDDWIRHIHRLKILGEWSLPLRRGTCENKERCKCYIQKGFIILSTRLSRLTLPIMLNLQNSELFDKCWVNLEILYFKYGLRVTLVIIFKIFIILLQNAWIWTTSVIYLVSFDISLTSLLYYGSIFCLSTLNHQQINFSRFYTKYIYTKIYQNFQFHL